MYPLYRLRCSLRDECDSWHAPQTMPAPVGGAGTVLWAAYFAAVAALIALVGVGWQLGGARMLRTIAPSLILLALIVGLPADADAAFLRHMRAWAVDSSSLTLVWLRIPHLIAGTVIEIPGSRLLVAEACSGINSLMAVLGFTLVLGFLRRRSPAIIAILMVAGVVLVLWANMIRIAGGAWLKAVWDIDILSGAMHQWASIILFSVCMGLIFSTDEVIILVKRWRAARHGRYRGGSPRTRDPVVTTPRSDETHAALFRISRSLWCIAFIFTVVGVAQFARGMARGELTVLLRHGTTLSALPENTVFAAPQELVGWQRSESAEKQVAQPETEGKLTQAWVYRQGELTAVVAIGRSSTGRDR